jgi:hypothetical protein
VKTSSRLQHQCQNVPTQQSIIALQLGSGIMMNQCRPILETHLFPGNTRWIMVWELCKEVCPLSLQGDPPPCVLQIEHISKSQMPMLLCHLQV